MSSCMDQDRYLEIDPEITRLRAEVERMTGERDSYSELLCEAKGSLNEMRNRAKAAERKLSMVSELILATSALIALFPANIDERQAAVIRRARVAISELEKSDDCNPSDYT
jgi:hypothetical protein